LMICVSFRKSELSYKQVHFAFAEQGFGPVWNEHPVLNDKLNFFRIASDLALRIPLDNIDDFKTRKSPEHRLQGVTVLSHGG
ncbi:MAG: hypothetical protein N3D16_11330, partial [Anaerolineales bacterium]|nr:hypothetical protein [Anaerolineales bacterium]